MSTNVDGQAVPTPRTTRSIYLSKHIVLHKVPNKTGIVRLLSSSRLICSLITLKSIRSIVEARLWRVEIGKMVGERHEQLRRLPVAVVENLPKMGLHKSLGIATVHFIPTKTFYHQARRLIHRCGALHLPKHQDRSVQSSFPSSFLGSKFS
jgi:hypothetical protein